MTTDDNKGRPIETEGGEIKQFNGGTTFEGPSATNAFRLKVIISALELEMKTGLRMSRGRSALAAAKVETGLRTNNREKQIAALQGKLQAQMEFVAVEPVRCKECGEEGARFGSMGWKHKHGPTTHEFAPDRPVE